MFNDLLGSIVYKLISSLLIMAITTTSVVPLTQRQPKATSAYLGMLQQLGLIQADFSTESGYRSTASEGMESLVPTLDENGEPVGFLLNADAFQAGEEDFAPPIVANPISVQ